MEQGTEYCSHCGSRVENLAESNPQPEKNVEEPQYTPNNSISNNSTHSRRNRKRKLGKSIALIIIVSMVLSGGSFSPSRIHMKFKQNSLIPMNLKKFLAN